jgi:hypothetical protein
MSGIDERSEKKAKELEEEAYENAKNGNTPVVDGSCLKMPDPKEAMAKSVEWISKAIAQKEAEAKKESAEQEDADKK